MKILPLHLEIKNYLRKRNLVKKFEKQKRIFETSPFCSSLKTKLLEPKKMRIWSFRVNRKYRAIFIFHKKDVVEIIDINNHYQ